MFKMILTLIASLPFLLSPLPALSGQGTVEGTITGVTCHLHGTQCPADKLDPHIALEKDFVVSVGDGGYYLVPNIDRAVLARWALDRVRVSGDVNERYKSVTADKLEVRKEGGWEVVWSQKMQDEAVRKLLHP